MEAPIKTTRLHLTEEPTTKGLRLTISLDMVDDEKRFDDLMITAIQYLSRTRLDWEHRCIVDNRIIAPTGGQ